MTKMPNSPLTCYSSYQHAMDELALLVLTKSLYPHPRIYQRERMS
jgi:hypothetical protein